MRLFFSGIASRCAGVLSCGRYLSTVRELAREPLCCPERPLPILIHDTGAFRRTMLVSGGGFGQLRGAPFWSVLCMTKDDAVDAGPLQ